MKKIIFLTLFILIMALPMISAQTLVDDFNRIDDPTVGTSTSGFVWNETEESGSGFRIQLLGNEMEYRREASVGNHITIHNEDATSINFTVRADITTGDGSIMILYENNTDNPIVALWQDTNNNIEYATDLSTLSTTELIDIPGAEQWVYNIVLVMDVSNFSIDAYFNDSRHNFPMLNEISKFNLFGFQSTSYTDNAATFRGYYDNIYTQNLSAFVDTPTFTPPVVDLLFPENDRLYNNPSPINVNYTIELDPVAEITTIEIFVNGTLNKTETTHVNSSIDIGEGQYNMTILVTDNNSNTGEFSINSFKIDRTNPFDNLNVVMPDGTVIKESTNISVTAQNTNLFGHNVTLRNSSGDIIFSQEDLNISAPSNTIIIDIDVASLTEGAYTIISNESDDHTDNIIPAYGVTHNNADKNILFNTGNAEVMIKLTEAYKQVGDAPYTPINGDLLGLSHNKLIDRYTFGFSFSNPAADSYKYKFQIITDEEIIYRPNSGYEGHFVIGGANWLDFEPYDITVTHDGTYYYIEFETTDTNVQFNSIGGTNFASTEVSFEILPPEALSLQCDFGSGLEDCTNAELGDTLTGITGQCNHNLFGFIGFKNITAGGSTIQFCFDGFIDCTNTTSTELSLLGMSHELSGDELNVTMVCTNQVELDRRGDDFNAIEIHFNASAPVPESSDGNTLSGFDGNTFATTLILLIFTIFIVGIFISRFKK